jgi:hypothetical protein
MAAFATTGALTANGRRRATFEPEVTALLLDRGRL